MYKSKKIKMYRYEWEICSTIGRVKARNMKEAIIKSFKSYLAGGPPPYISDENEQIEIYIVRLKKGEKTEFDEE